MHFEEGNVELPDAPESNKGKGKAVKQEKSVKVQDSGDKVKSQSAGNRSQRILDQVAEEADLEKISGQILDQASGLSIRQVLAASPELRKICYRKQEPRTALEQVVRVSSVKTRGDAVHAADEDLYAVTCPIATVQINGVQMKALFDSGSKINVISAKWAKRAQLPLRSGALMTMLGVTGGVSHFVKVCMSAKVNLGGAKRSIPVFVVETGDYSLILGRVYKRKARLSKRNTDNRCCKITVMGDGADEVTVQASFAENRSNRTLEEVFSESLKE